MVATPRQVTVTSTPTEHVTYAKNRRVVTLHNLGNADIFLGADNSVSTTNGFPLGAGKSATLAEIFGNDPREAIWFVSAANQTLAIREGYSFSMPKGAE